MEHIRVRVLVFSLSTNWKFDFFVDENGNLLPSEAIGALSPTDFTAIHSDSTPGFLLTQSPTVSPSFDAGESLCEFADLENQSQYYRGIVPRKIIDMPLPTPINEEAHDVNQTAATTGINASNSVDRLGIFELTPITGIISVILKHLCTPYNYHQLSSPQSSWIS